MSSNISKFYQRIIRKDNYPYFVIFLLSFISILWLHGGIIFFWNTKLPVFPYYELTHFTSTWAPYNEGSISLHPDTEVTYFLLYTIFYFLAFKSLFLTQQLMIFIIFMISGFSSYMLLNFIFSNFNKNNGQSIFALIGALFYMFNYFDDILIYQIHPYWISYSILPLALYFILKGALKADSRTQLIKYSLVSSFLLELIFSFTISWEPILIYIILIIIVYYLIFKNRMLPHNSLHQFHYFFMIIVFSLLLNLWWLSQFFHLVSVDAVSTNSSVINGVIQNFSTNGYRLQFWSVITIYPLLYPIQNTNAFLFTGEYYSYNSIFFFISIVFFLVVLFPLFNINSKNSLLNKREKIILYLLLFLLIFIGMQGFNPLNRILIIFLKIHMPYIIPYLYSTIFYFIEIPIISIYILLFPVSIYEIVHFKFNKTGRYRKKFLSPRLSILLDRNKKVLAVILVILIIGIFPYYMFTPLATMDYIDGNNHVPSVVKFPSTFDNLLNYIHQNSDGSTTLILPQSYNMFSVNFSSNNTFINAESPSFLTGSETLLCEPILTTQIDNFISGAMPNDSHFSIFLNDINVKFIIVDKNVDSFIPGYGFITNTSQILNYINTRTNLSIVSDFGPLILYKNNNYNGIVDTGPYSYFNPSISDPYNESNIMPYLNNFSISEPYGNYTFNDQNLSFCANLSEYNPIHFVNTESLNVNISYYNCLIIKTGNITKNSQLLVYTNALFINGNKGRTGIARLSPLNITTNRLENICYLGKSNTTYILPLYQYGSNGYASSVNKNGTTLNYIHFGMTSSQQSNSTYTFNISKIYFAKYISPAINTYEIMSENSQNDHIIGNYSDFNSQITTDVNVVYRELTPTNYEINVTNATAPFALLFKQNYNVGWELAYNNKILNTHFEGDEYANAWLVNKTGNYTLHLFFAPQKIVSMINHISIFINVILLTGLIAIIIYSRRRN